MTIYTTADIAEDDLGSGFHIVAVDDDDQAEPDWDAECEWRRLYAKNPRLSE